MVKFFRKDLFWSAVLLTSLVLLSFKFLNLWFIMDDTSCIYASAQNALRMIFDRDTYLFFNKMFYTPLLPISFGLDYFFFGLHPLGYHIHNMLAAFFTGLMGYKVYRLYLPRFESWIGTFLFVLSFAAINNIGWLSTRHYLWGMFFVLASFFFFKKAEHHANRAGVLLSYFFYIIAVFFKEAFAPLPVIVFLLSEGGFKEKTLRSLPYFLMLGCYLGLRYYILGSLGGYLDARPDPIPISILTNYLSELSVVSKVFWGAPLWLAMLIFIPLFFLNKRIAVVCAVLIGVTTIPFMFLKASDTIDDYTVFYFPSKFMLPLFIFSGAVASMHACSRKRDIKIFSLLFACLLLMLQIMHADASYAFIKRSAEDCKKLTAEALSRNSQGKDILIFDRDFIFYNFFYESYSNPAKSVETNLGTVITFDNPDLFGLLQGRLNGRFDSVYRDGKWSDGVGEKITNTAFRIDNTIPKPTVSMDLNGRHLSFTVVDSRGGSFYGALISTFSSRNVAVRSMPLPKHVPFKLGLTKGKEVVYLFYCDGGRCSEPVVIKP